MAVAVAFGGEVVAVAAKFGGEIMAVVATFGGGVVSTAFMLRIGREVVELASAMAEVRDEIVGVVGDAYGPPLGGSAVVTLAVGGGVEA